MRVVIVGGGFAGVTLAQQLERRAPADLEIVLISSENHLVFSPMLAEAVGRTVSPLHIVVAGRAMVKRTRWLTARASEIDFERSEAQYVSPGGEHGTISYDHLVLACGSVVNLNTVPGLAADAYPLKTLGDATFLGNDIIARLEEASVESDPDERRRLLTVVVIGGGFSGVEVAGEIDQLMDRARRFYPELKNDRGRVILLHRGDRILPELNAVSLSEFALRKLRATGIDVRLNAEASEVTGAEVWLKSGEHIPAATIVCTVGNAPNPLIQTLGLPLEHGRLKTEADMRVAGTQNVWAIGDCAAVPNARDGKPSPPTGQFATRQAQQLARNLHRVLQGQPTRPFSYRAIGILASLGHRNAVAEILGFKLSGFPAWFLWRGIYLSKLPTLGRKVEVAIDWAWQILFPPNIVELEMARTNRVGRSHYAAGEYVYRKGESGDRFYVIEAGTAGAYLDENAEPVAILKPGDHFGEGALLAPDRSGRHSISVKAMTALDLITLNRDDFTQLSKSLGVLQKAVHRSVLARKGYLGFLDMVKHEPELNSIRVADIMSSPAVTLSPDLPLAEAVARFHNGKPGYPVAGADGKLAGYCGRSELYDAMRELLPVDTPVVKFMRSDPPAIDRNRMLPDAALTLMREQIEVLPVVEADGRIAGVISPIDIFRKALQARGTAESLQT